MLGVGCSGFEVTGPMYLGVWGRIFFGLQLQKLVFLVVSGSEISSSGCMGG